MRAIASRFTLASLFFVGLTVFCWANEEAAEIDPKSGLRIDAEENWKLVKAHCSSCHSERLITQQQLDRANWLKSIRRMQSEENLWDLGASETKILDYLDTYYSATDKPRNQRVRRAQLSPAEKAPHTETVPQSTDNNDGASENAKDSRNSSESESSTEEEKSEI